MNNLTLITGAVRSGKSIFAEKLAADSNQPVTYLATMPKLDGDEEQADRIARHRERRPASWRTIEEPYNLPPAIKHAASQPGIFVLDCLSVYVSNLLLAACDEYGHPHRQDERVLTQVEDLLQTIGQLKDCRFLVVTNEVGWGVVPETPLGRSFRDILGLTNQRFAAESSEVWLTCVGLPLRLKPQAPL